MLTTCFWGTSLGLAFLSHFLHVFFKKNISQGIIDHINWSNFTVWLPLLLEKLGNICIVIICFQVWDAANFEINHSFLIKPFPYVTKKVRIKIQISSDQKELFRRNKKHFSQFLKALTETNKTNFFEKKH